MEAEFRDSVRATFYKHCGSIRMINKTANHVCRISGFFYEEESSVFFVTAGHVVEDVANYINMADYKCELDDHIHKSGHVSRENVIRLSSEKLLDRFTKRYDSNNDWAFFKCDYLEEQCLRQNGIVPLTGCIQATICNFFWLLGTPSESIHTLDFPTENSAYCLVRAVAESVYPDEIVAADGFFLARIPPEEETMDNEHDLRSIEGMSGGPILGFVSHGNSLEYGIVGIQSTWWSLSRCIKFGLFETCRAAIRDSLSTHV